MRRLALLLGFVLTLVVSAGCASVQLGNSPPSHLDSLRAENDALRAQLREVEDSLERRSDVQTGQYYRDLRVLNDQLNRLIYEVRTLRDGGQTVLVLSADALFELGTATLTSEGAKRLQAVIDHLQSTYPTRTIRVEGHTSNTPLSDELQKRFASNWELSAARATTVVRHLIENSDLAPAQFVAVGYGATDPVASNETAQGRRRNRRVRIAVLPSPRDYSRPFETAW